MKFKHKYLYRLNAYWVFRYLKDTKDGFYKSFFDIDYGGKVKSKIAAEKYITKKLNSLPLKMRLRLRNGYPKLKLKAGVLIGTRIIKGVRVENYYIAKAYNKYTKATIKKTFSFGRCRSREEAHKLAIQFRRKAVLEIKKTGLALGYSNS